MVRKIVVRKLLNPSDIDYAQFISLCETQRLPDKYITKETEIEYFGDYCHFTLLDMKFLAIIGNGTNYNCPKIQYIPSERNLLSVIENTDKISNLPPMVVGLGEELKKANRYNSKYTNVNILDFKVRYQESEDMLYVQAPKSELYIPITEASSGLQSIIPLLIVVDYLTRENARNVLEKIKNTSSFLQQEVLTSILDEELRNKVDLFLKSGVKKNLTFEDEIEMTTFIKNIINVCNYNIVEEPEQNLFPLSQVEIMDGLICHYNDSELNKLLITTHSPYILSAINNYIYAAEVYEKTGKTIKEISKDLFVNISDVSAFKIENGRIYNILDLEYGLIDTSEIDGCSSKINAIYDKLLSLGD